MKKTTHWNRSLVLSSCLSFTLQFLNCGELGEEAKLRVIESSLREGQLSSALTLLEEFKPADKQYSVAMAKKTEIANGMAMFKRLAGNWYYNDAKGVNTLLISEPGFEQKFDGNTLYRRDTRYASAVESFGEGRANRAYPWKPYLRFLGYPGGNFLKVRQFDQSPEEVTIHP